MFGEAHLPLSSHALQGCKGIAPSFVSEGIANLTHAFNAYVSNTGRDGNLGAKAKLRCRFF